jgi:predicted DCC family thiol-disulfide oxidoreductase YuxK
MPRPKIIYDNKCHFCISTKSRFEKLDRKAKFEWVGIDNSNYKKYNLKKEDLLKEMHLILNNKVYKGYYAFRQISKRIPVFFVFYLISLIPGIDFIGRKIYGFIARHRYV